MQSHFFHILAAAGMAFLITGTANAKQISLLQNGGFEDGPGGCGLGIPHWNSSYNTIASSYAPTGVKPHEGKYMAVMSAFGGFFDSHLQQSFNPGAGYDHFDFSFAFNLAALDFNPFGDWGRDKLSVSIGQFSKSFYLNDLFDTSLTVTGWKEVHIEDLAVSDFGGGPLSVQFKVENFGHGGGDPGQLFQAYIDSVSAIGKTGSGSGGGGRSSVPDSASTILLLAVSVSLFAMGLFRRRKTTTA